MSDEYEEESPGNEEGARGYGGDEAASSRQQLQQQQQQQQQFARHSESSEFGESEGGSDPEYRTENYGEEEEEEEEQDEDEEEDEPGGGFQVYNSSNNGSGPSRRGGYYPSQQHLQNNNVGRVRHRDEDYEEEDDEDGNGGDDPHDADFEPGSPQVSHQDDDDEYDDAEEPEEEAEDDYEDDGGLYESEDDYKQAAVPKKRQTSKAAPRMVPVNNTNSQKRRKPVRRRDDFSDDDMFGEYSEEESKQPSLYRGQQKRTMLNTEATLSASYPDTSGRSSRRVPRKSYAEEHSEQEDDEDEKPKKKALDEIEDDQDRVERVLWHQPRGMAEEAILKGKRPDPYILDTDPNVELNWDEQEFYIKWKGQSYLHCQWQALDDLSQLGGYKKVQNYMKKVEGDRRIRRKLSREEAEVHDLNKEMDLDLLRQFVEVERVFADRIVTSEEGEENQEYLVKWKGLSYAEASWERDTDLHFAQGFIDEYKEREASCQNPGKSVDVQRNKSQSTLRKVDEQPEWLRGGTLRDYQLEGLSFLLNSWRTNRNVILADEMGLGKTVQSVSMLGYLQNALDLVGPFLVIVPLSTIQNWTKEFRKWLPNMNVLVYVGNRLSREMCQKYEFYTSRKTGRIIKFNTLVTTPEIVMKDKDILSKIRWDYLLVDEAHRLKNSASTLYTILMDFSTKNKVLVTGTPLQNSVEELWALLHFLDPHKFRFKEEFVEKYKGLTSLDASKQPADKTAMLQMLHAELGQHMLRRVIKDVEKSLPPKIERILRVEMTPLQKQYYKWILERNYRDLNKGVRGTKQVSLLNIVVELKKCCNHPFLFLSAEAEYNAITDSNEKKMEKITLSSGKVVLLDKLLVRLRETGHRVLIFSQMVKMLDILAEYLSLRGFKFQRLDGSTKHDIRQQAMEHFNAPGSEDFCFLLSTRAGGLGINLATADTVIIFDSDWNPQNDLQAMSRAHRIGQKQVVNVYRFVTCRSVEEDILERAKRKMVLDHLVIQQLNEKKEKKEKKETNSKNGMFDSNELAAILRFGAEELFKEDPEEAEKKLKNMGNMNIDEILDRAEQVNSEGQEGNELLGAFKVANFSQSSDDVAFWSRLIPNPGDAPEEGPTPSRRARNSKAHAEDPKLGRSSRTRGSEDRTRRRRTEPPAPRVEGAAAQVISWDAMHLGKKDATAFVKGVKKFGDKSKIDMIVSEAGVIADATEDEQLELYDMFIEGCTEATENSFNSKSAILDFFGASVKAQEALSRVKDLTQLGKRIKKCSDPQHFRLRTTNKAPSWGRSNWTQVDDARLLLGVHIHGLGNWDKIRADSKLGLSKKIPAGEGVPKPSHLEARVNMLLRRELESEKDKGRGKRGQAADEGSNRLRSGLKDRARPSARPTGTRKSVRNINREAALAAAAAAAAKESEDKEEGEISDEEESLQQGKKKIQEKDREQRWFEWCKTALQDENNILEGLQSLSASENVSNDEVVRQVRRSLRKLGERIDSILYENRKARCSAEKMAVRLWNYVAEFSNLPGSTLAEIYRKLKEDNNDSDKDGGQRSGKGKEEPVTYKRRRGRTAEESVSWKRRRRDEAAAAAAAAEPS